MDELDQALSIQTFQVLQPQFIQIGRFVGARSEVDQIEQRFFGLGNERRKWGQSDNLPVSNGSSALLIRKFHSDPIALSPFPLSQTP